MLTMEREGVMGSAEGPWRDALNGGLRCPLLPEVQTPLNYSELWWSEPVTVPIKHRDISPWALDPWSKPLTQTRGRSGETERKRERERVRDKEKGRKVIDGDRGWERDGIPSHYSYGQYERKRIRKTISTQFHFLEGIFNITKWDKWRTLELDADNCLS